MIKVGIIGSTGYAGAEIVRLIQQHKEAEVVWFGSRSYVDEKYADVFKNMFQIVDAKCMDDNMEELADAVDVIFTATPQGLCGSLVNEEILKKVKIIDLSADFRIKMLLHMKSGMEQTPEPTVYRRSSIRIMRSKQRQNKRCKINSKSGMLPNM